MKTQGPILGIDLGTTNSLVAIVREGAPVILKTRDGGHLVPSVVSLIDGKPVVGGPAKRAKVVDAAHTVFSVKRLLGRGFDDLKETAGTLPYSIVPSQEGMVRIRLGERSYTAIEISAMILQKLKQAAEEYLGQTVTKAVITVPAYFNDAQRQATKDAGQIAGLEVMRIVNEPTAAALAYGLDKKKDETIAVYDFGGGTFDISILEVGEGVVEVKATNGDTHLGGDDWDHALMDWVLAEFKSDSGIDLTKQPDAIQRICADHHAAEPPAGKDHQALHIVRVVSGMNALRVDAQLYGGVVPEIASRAHLRAIGPTVTRAVEEAGGWSVIDAICPSSAVTRLVRSATALVAGTPPA